MDRHERRMRRKAKRDRWLGPLLSGGFPHYHNGYPCFRDHKLDPWRDPPPEAPRDTETDTYTIVVTMEVK